MAHLNSAHRGVRIAAVLAAVSAGATACKRHISDHRRSSEASSVNEPAPRATETPRRVTASQRNDHFTAHVVDIEARLVTARAGLERVRTLLETATDLGQILSLESQLIERETLVEQYVAMKRAIEERASLATLPGH